MALGDTWLEGFRGSGMQGYAMTPEEEEALRRRIREGLPPPEPLPTPWPPQIETAQRTRYAGSIPTPDSLPDPELATPSKMGELGSWIESFRGSGRPYLEKFQEAVTPYIPVELRSKVKGANKIADTFSTAASLRDYGENVKEGNYGSAVLDAVGAVPGAGQVVAGAAKAGAAGIKGLGALFSDPNLAINLGPMGISALFNKTVPEVKQGEKVFLKANPIYPGGVLSQDSKDMYYKSGLNRTVDDKMAFELRDQGVRLEPRGLPQAGDIGDVQDFEAIWKAQKGSKTEDVPLDQIYNLSPIRVGLQKGEPQGGALFYPDTGVTRILMDPALARAGDKEVLKNVIHERSHAVAAADDMAKGGAPEWTPYLPEYWTALGKPASNASDPVLIEKEINRVRKELDTGRYSSPEATQAMNMYRSDIGESAARNSENRFDFSQLYNLHPLETMNLIGSPIEKQIDLNKKYYDSLRKLGFHVP